MREKGYVLSELMVTLALFSIVLAAIYGFYYMASHSWQTNYHTAHVRQEYFNILSDIKEKLREAQPLENEPAIVHAEQNKIIFYANLDSDPGIEKVEYAIDGQKLVRKIYQPDSDEEPYDYSSPPETRILTENCLNSSQLPLFAYMDEHENEITGFPLNETKRAQVKIVKINLALNNGTEVEPGILSLESEVWIRNVAKHD